METPGNVLVGEDPTFRALIDAARLVAVTDVAVLILGESGTGKELLARHLHDESRRSNKPFVSINCAALPEGLFESELFGHRKGAFTGADRDYPGRIGAADGGTVFLDEVAELPLAVQAKLLRFLESGECQAVGDPMPHRVDVRVIAATHRDLGAMVDEGRFRQDLYYRLNVVPMELPPLRARTADIPLLIWHLTAEVAVRYALPAPRYSKQAVVALRRYSWPGNIRELRNVCERNLVLFSGKAIDVENLPLEMRANTSGSAPARSRFFDLPDTGIRLEELERHMISQALTKSLGNRSRAARLLGMTRDTLLYRMKKYAMR